MTVFWFIAAIGVLASLGLVFAPMLRGAGRGERRASYDMQVYRDQLREIDTDRRRGVLSADEAEATRAEIARRLIAAADAEAGEAGSAAAPARLSRMVAVALVLGVALASLALYARFGVPGFPDQPLAQRLAGGGLERAARPSQAEAEARAEASGLRPPVEIDPQSAGMVTQLEEILRSRPDDLQGHRLLARSLAAVGRLPEARAAQARVVELLGPEVQAGDLADHAELMIFAAAGYVSPEAEAALAAALARDPDEPRTRYYSGLAALQAGRPDITYPLWARLLDEGPADAPWIPTIAAEIDEIGRLAGAPPRAPAGGPVRGPAPGDVDAAAEMTDAERAAMVEGMVAGLATRLSEEGGPPQDWAQLIRALIVLGRIAEAQEIRAEAQAAFAGDAAALALIEAAAGGLAP